MYAHLTITQLRAAILAAAKQDIRYYINGVYVECDSIRTRVVATNGHILYVQDHMPSNPNTWQGSMIIPRDVLELALKASTRYNIDLAVITVEDIGDSQNPRLSCALRMGGNASYQMFSPIEGIFPDYTRAIPVADYECTLTHLNPDYVSIMHKIAKVHGAKTKVGFTIHQNGLDASLVSFWNEPNAIGVIMPIRNSEDLPSTEQYRERIYTPPTAKQEQTTPEATENT